MAVIAHIQGYRQTGQNAQALQAIDQALETLMGLRANLLKHLSDEKLLNMLTTQETLDVERLAILADLYKEEGEVLSLQGREAESGASLQRALRFYVEVALDDPAQMQEDILLKIEALRPKLDSQSLSVETQMALLDYLERLQRLSDSELAQIGCARPTLQAQADKLNRQMKDLL